MEKKEVYYKTVINKRGKWRIKHWTETIIDEGTGKPFKLKRSVPIKLNGKKLRFYSDSEIRSMTTQQRKDILI